jgi:8-amino-7-oxononanoate synthase
MRLPRLHARVAVQTRAMVNVQGETHGCEVASLSVSGAMLVGGPRLDLGREVMVEIDVPTVPDKTTLFLRAHVVRYQELGDAGLGVGVAFEGTTMETEGMLALAVTEAYKQLGARVLGQVRGEMARRGVTDIAQVADELQRIKEEQARAHLFASDLFTEEGSNAVAQIVSGTTGESRECIVWSLNLYLGLNRQERVLEKVRDAVTRFGTGAGTSPPSGGLSRLHHSLESRIATMVGKQKALVFSTGYAANLGALSALPGPKDLVLLDREAHASMIDGVKLSGKKWLVFNHNDVDDLANKLERYAPHHENVFVAVEGAYSMSGDLAPLKEIAALKEKHRFFLYVDEAHTFGFYGNRGAGWCDECGVTDKVDFIMSTFSKATASIGGFVACDEKYATLLQATATPYIFQACLPPPDAAAILASLDEIQDEPAHARALHDNNRYMRQRLEARGFDLGHSRSPVIPVYVPDLEKLYRLCAQIYLEGIFTVPVVYPAVGANEGRLRFIVNAHHTTEQIDRTVAVLTRHALALGILSPMDKAA